jgi:hypothetical protein
MDKEINDRSINPLIRIADAIEEILRLVKLTKRDQERTWKEKKMGFQRLKPMMRIKKNDLLPYFIRGKGSAARLCCQLREVF